MNSRKKKSNGLQNSSSRTLDGRRVRTVHEAKALAEYLATKPEEERRARKERRERLEGIVEAAERKRDEILNGGKARNNEQWVEDKEEAAAKAREAVMQAVRIEDGKRLSLGRESDESAEASQDSEDLEVEEDGGNSTSENGESSSSAKGRLSASRTFHGWDEEELSDSDEEDENDKK